MNSNPASVPAGQVPSHPTSKLSFAKVGWVITGYLLALLFAAGVVAASRLLSVNSDGTTSSGMAAFGDALIFLAVFTVGCIPPTCVALYFLRSKRAFWPVAAALALTFVVTGLVALTAWFMNPRSLAASLGFIRILLAPLAALLFLLGGLFAPRREPKLLLFSSASLEVMVFAAWVITCLLRNR